MSRTIRKLHPTMYSWNIGNGVCRWTQTYYYEEQPIHDLKKYTRDGNHNTRYCYPPGYRGGTSGFMSNGMPSGWDDDLHRDKESRRSVNRRRRNWGKKLIEEQLKDFDK